MAVEAFVWPDPPTLTDGDDNTTYVMGTQFHVLADTVCRGVQWYVPDSVETPPGGTHVAALWNSDTTTRLEFKNFVPSPGTIQDITFDTPQNLVVGVTYVASILTIHYTFRSVAPGWEVESPSLNLVGDDGKLSASSDPTTFPAGSFDTWFYISPLADAPGTPTPDGIPIPVSLGTPSVGDASSPAPAGLAVPVALGTPSVGDASSPAPAGLAVPVTLGTPAVGDASSPVPAGLPIPVSLGTPSVGDASSPAPNGLAVPVALGAPSVSLPAAVPNGLPIPVSLGTPAVGDASSPAPSGLPIPVTLGTPAVGPTVFTTHLPPMSGTAVVVSGLTGTATVLSLTGTATIL